MCQVDNHYANCAYFLDTQDQLLIYNPLPYVLELYPHQVCQLD